MSKEEPAWKAALGDELDEKFISSGDEIFDLVQPHIKAAEQRGFQAGVNKTGDSVGKLREQLKTAKDDALREVLTSFICGLCGQRVGWIDCPTGGWWAHETHPSDEHDATECTPYSEPS